MSGLTQEQRAELRASLGRSDSTYITVKKPHLAALLDALEEAEKQVGSWKATAESCREVIDDSPDATHKLRVVLARRRSGQSIEPTRAEVAEGALAEARKRLVVTDGLGITVCAACRRSWIEPEAHAHGCPFALAASTEAKHGS